MSELDIHMQPSSDAPPVVTTTKKEALVATLKQAGCLALELSAPLYLVSLIRQCLHLAEKL